MAAEKIVLDLTGYHQSQADIELCCIALGFTTGSRSFYMPQGDMASDDFDRMEEEAWERLTPGQQKAILNGQFVANLPQLYNIDENGEPDYDRPVQ